MLINELDESYLTRALDQDGGGGLQFDYIAPPDLSLSPSVPPVVETLLPSSLPPPPSSPPHIAQDALPPAPTQWSIAFTFKDGKTGEPLAVNGKLIDLGSNSVLSTITNSLEANVSVADVPAYQLQAEFFKNGYKKISLNLGNISQSQVVLTFERTSHFPYLELLALLALVAFAKKRKKQVGAVTTKDVLPFMLIGGGLLAFSIVKKLLEFLGVWESHDSKNLDNEAQDPSSPWNPTLWQRLQSQGVKWSYAITYDQAAELVQQLQNAFGPFNDDEEQAIAIFKNFRTQANASFFADVFQRITGQDLLSYVRGGSWPQDRLSDADVYSLNNFLHNLKQY
jgi:hypothetical protein